MAAGKMASGGLGGKARPLGCTVICNAAAALVMGWVSSGQMPFLKSPDCAFKPTLSRRPAGALSPSTPADRRLRRHRSTGAAPAANRPGRRAHAGLGAGLQRGPGGAAAGARGSGPHRCDRPVALAGVLRQRSLPQALVYASTSGVYGDCQGALVPETRRLAPATPRAQRRASAERVLRELGRAGLRVSLLRIPGIYAADRAADTVQDRLRRAIPVLRPEDDVFTSHIHADDLARACIAALWHGRPQRAYNVSDLTPMKMGDYFDLAAGLYGLPRPPRPSRSAAQQHVSPLRLSFMGESRRLDNQRLRRELGLRLLYPGVAEGLAAGRRTDGIADASNRPGATGELRAGQCGELRAWRA